MRPFEKDFHNLRWEVSQIRMTSAISFNMPQLIPYWNHGCVEMDARRSRIISDLMAKLSAPA